ncbi:MAG: zinc metalloprotease HtpX [Desulfovibrionaceae bacterium]
MAHRLLAHRLRNAWHTTVFIAGMAGIMAAVGWAWAGDAGILWALALAVALLALSPRLSPLVTLRLYGARPIIPSDAPALHHALDEIAGRAGLRTVPRLHYIRSAAPNAFAVGDARHTHLALTDGLLRALDYRELVGVLGHEISHVRHNDMWLMTAADIFSRVTSVFSLLGQFLLLISLPAMIWQGHTPPWPLILLLMAAPYACALLQLALSRNREYEADLEAAVLTGDPRGLALALAKMERRPSGLWRLLLPSPGEPHPSVLRSHPDTDRRVRRLLSLTPGDLPHPPLRALAEEAAWHSPPPFARILSPPHWRLGGYWF